MAAQDRSQLKKDYLWNTLGSVMSAASSFILLLVVTRVMGPYTGGVFALAYSLAQQFQCLGAYEMRPYQATDVSESHSFKTYFLSRVLTCSLMVVCVLGYAFFTNGFTYDAVLIIAVATLRFYDAFEDVFHGAFQQKGRLDIAGRAFFFRVLATTLAFSLAVFLLHDLLASCAFTALVSVAILVILLGPPTKQLLSFASKTDLRDIFALLKTCTPLFIGAFLAMYLVNAPRFGIEGQLSKEYQTFYSVLFMPALAINLLSGFVFKPLLTSLAKSWQDGNRKSFVGIIFKGVVIVLIASVLLVVFQIPILMILGLLYGLDLGSYQVELCILILGGAFNAIGILLYYGLVTMRRQKTIMASYAATALATLLVGSSLIAAFQLAGATLLYCFSMALLATLFAIALIANLKRTRASSPAAADSQS